MSDRHQDKLFDDGGQKAYEVLTQLSADLVNIHNGFHFDLDRMAAHVACSSVIAHTCEERNLGNSGAGVYWKVPNGVTIIDSVHYIDKDLRRDWGSMSLASIASELGLSPKFSPTTQ